MFRFQSTELISEFTTSNRKLEQRLKELNDLFNTNRILKASSLLSSAVNGVAGGGNLPSTSSNSLINKLRIVKLNWLNKYNAITMFLNNGLIIWLFYECNNLKILKNIYFDRYLVGKLLSDNVINIHICERNIFITYLEPKLTAIFFNQNDGEKKNSYKLKSHKNLSIYHHDLKLITNNNFNFNSKRKIERNLLINLNESLLLIWSQNIANFISQWVAPGQLNNEQINLLVFNCANNYLNLISFASITNEIFKISFSKMKLNHLFIIENNGQINNQHQLRLNTYEIDEENCLRSMVIINSVLIKVDNECLKVDFNSNCDKLVILCENYIIQVYYLLSKQLIKFRPSINLIDIICNQLDSFFIAIDDYGQILMYDYTCNVITANYDDLMLNEISIGLKCAYYINEKILAIHFLNDEKIYLNNFFTKIDLQTLISEYLKYDYVNEAINNLKLLDWNINAYTIYSCINLIFNHLTKLTLNETRSIQIEQVLALFFRSTSIIDEQIYDDFRIDMHYLARKFFYHLIRYSCFDKAFLLALDIKSINLFKFLSKIAQQRGQIQLSHVAVEKANELIMINNERQRKMKCSLKVKTKSSSLKNSSNEQQQLQNHQPKYQEHPQNVNDNDVEEGSRDEIIVNEMNQMTMNNYGDASECFVSDINEGKDAECNNACAQQVVMLNECQQLNSGENFFMTQIKNSMIMNTDENECMYALSSRKLLDTKRNCHEIASESEMETFINAQVKVNFENNDDILRSINEMPDLLNSFHTPTSSPSPLPPPQQPPPVLPPRRQVSFSRPPLPPKRNPQLLPPPPPPHPLSLPPSSTPPPLPTTQPPRSFSISSSLSNDKYPSQSSAIIFRSNNNSDKSSDLHSAHSQSTSISDLSLSSSLSSSTIASMLSSSSPTKLKKEAKNFINEDLISSTSLDEDKRLKLTANKIECIHFGVV